MLTYILQEPAWLQLWVGWLVLINTASVFFLRHLEARWALAAWLGNVLFMSALFELAGYTKLLGLSHVLFWTPLILYLVAQRTALRRSRPLFRWASLLTVTNSVSLIIDYVDVFRYFIGGRTG